MGEYDDIINMPHHVSNTHKQMTLLERAAQFAPFAALTGFDGQIEETARLTDERLELSEERQYILNAKIQILRENCYNDISLKAVYFIKDSLKEGGMYITKEGIFRWIDDYNKNIVFSDGDVVPLCDVYALDSELFEILDDCEF